VALTKENVRRFIEGQRALNALVREETWRRLATLTVDAARQEYDALCRLWESSPARHDLGDLDRMRIHQLVRLRQRLDLAARRRRAR
jgi:hypothetical protein